MNRLGAMRAVDQDEAAVASAKAKAGGGGGGSSSQQAAAAKARRAADLQKDAARQGRKAITAAGSIAARRREIAIKAAALAGPIREELMAWRHRFENGGMKQPVDVSDYNLHLSVVQVRLRCCVLRVRGAGRLMSGWVGGWMCG